MWWLEAWLFDHGTRFLFFHIENTKVRAWGSIITPKSKFPSHTFRGGVGKDIEDPCSRLLRDRLCPEAFMVVRRRTSHSWHWHHPGSVFKGSVLSIILNPRSRLTIAWPNCFLDADFGLDSSTFIVYLGKEIKPIRTLNPNCYRGLFWSWYTWINENLN